MYKGEITACKSQDDKENKSYRQGIFKLNYIVLNGRRVVKGVKIFKLLFIIGQGGKLFLIIADEDKIVDLLSSALFKLTHFLHFACGFVYRDRLGVRENFVIEI